MENSSPKKIRLGICMAGAVSAGAYTAGVIDYLMETLERWQQRKDSIRSKRESGQALTPWEAKVPSHEVVIEVLSGASAGGMTAAVLGYSFNDDSYCNKRQGKIIDRNYPVPEADDEHSKLYRSWITMVDDKLGSTFKKLMDPSDAAPLNEMRSILNSIPVDQIAANAIPAVIQYSPPAYVSEQLSILLSVTNLEGIPIDIRFSNVDKNDPTCNVLKMHSGFLHYQFKEQSLQIDYPAEIISEKTKDHLAAAAKATGAFPFGLSNRKISVNHQFFKEFKKRLKANYNIDVNLQLPDNSNYVFNAVDGGVINNEPIGTTVKILECKKKDDHPQDENYVILIDPFPSVTNAAKRQEYTAPGEYTLVQQAKKLIGAIRNQSMFRQEDLLNGLEMDKNRFLIYPTKRKYYFLACGLIEGFSGFLKKEFREHDYQLGRKNCQTFLRFYFGETPEVLQAITGVTLSAAEVDHFKYDVNFGKKGEPPLWKIPMIPDMLLLNSTEEIETPKYNGLTTAEIGQAIQLIDDRIRSILDKSYPSVRTAATKLSGVLGWLFGVFPVFLKNKITRYLSSQLSEYLVATFYPQTLKQDQLLLYYLQLLVKHGQQYQKSGKVWARVAKGGEMIVSVTSDGRETQNIASVGDFIVKNDTTTKEEYIVKPDKFHLRYVPSPAGEFYVPCDNARVYALQVTRDNILHHRLEGLQPLLDHPEKPIFIEAPWSEAQTLRLGDYLVCPPAKDEIYRVARTEFDQTYALVQTSEQ